MVGRALIIFFAAGACAMPASLKTDSAERFANLALACVHREYPNKIAHVLNSDADVKPPRQLTPAFYGCYDWHSSVHGHWLLARLAATFPDEPFAARAKAALAQSLTPPNLRREADYINGEGRSSFERPYGLAWLLQLAAELHEWKVPEAREWSAAMKPVEAAAVTRISDWLGKLPHTVRSGEHSNTAFGLGLMLDYSKIVGNADFERLVERKTREFFLADRDCPLAYEPSGEDFLSPCLAEADAVRRVVHGKEFADWLAHFLPSIPQDGSTAWMRPGVVTDPSDGKLAHFDGLNLSRAWMLYGIASALPEGDRRVPSLNATAAAHASSGLRSVTGEHYEGGHWLGSFAVYLTTKRGLEPLP
ncbi:MAG TPA: DUF2891 domain-containing protein [Bryobacteraceae bacterium]|nr:DUF2891 domain-containing protein [Bryobacteraceae bacterium]